LTNSEDGNVFELSMSPNLFPFRDHDKTLKVETIWLLARCTNAGNYKVIMTPPLTDPLAVPIELTLAPTNQYGGLYFQQKDVASMNIKVVPEDPPCIWRFEMTGPGNGNLKVGELEDVLFVVAYMSS
jgi:hypothetical protein